MQRSEPKASQRGQALSEIDKAAGEVQQVPSTL